MQKHRSCAFAVLVIATLMISISSAATIKSAAVAGNASAPAQVTVPRIPVIVAEVSLTNETGLIPATTLVTPATDTLYRVSVYMVQDSANSGQCSSFSDCGFVISNLFWTDNGGPQFLQPFGINFASCDKVPTACQSLPDLYGARQWRNVSDVFDHWQLRRV
jgi:hypothetical protein